MATLKTRIQNKHDVEENWNKATGFTPMEGELIIYDADSTHSYKRLKIGDGVTNVINLPFFNDNLENRVKAIEDALKQGTILLAQNEQNIS